jgi:hypothetical protein
MKVERVTATIRYSKEENGAWKSLELGAEASIAPEDDWQISQALLYVELAGQLKTLWAANGHKPQEPAQNDSGKPVQEATWEEIQSMPSPKAHWCPLHNVEFRRFEKNGRFWYSHKDGDGWCKEQPPLTGKGR